MKNVVNIIVNYWLNKKSVRRSFDDKGEVIGLSFKDINYDALFMDCDLVTLMQDNPDELNFRHGRAGTTFKDKEGVVKVIKKDFFYVGLDQRTSYDDTDSLFESKPVSK